MNDSYVTVKCTGCNIPFSIFKSKYYYSKSKKFYHDKECFLLHSDFKGSKKGKFTENYLCRHCGKYIKKSKAKMYKTITGDHVYPVCSDPLCGNYRLRVSARNEKKRTRKLKQQLQQLEQKQIISVLQNRI